MSVHRDISEDVQPDMLLAHRDINIFHFFCFRDQASSPDVVTSLFVYLANGTIKIIFILVDFSSGEAPIRSFFPALDKHDGV